MQGDNDELPKFTLQEYIEYLAAPQWQLDGYESEAAYESEWCGKVLEWHDQGENEYKHEKDVWKNCYDALRQAIMRGASSSAAFEENIAAARIPVLLNSCMDEVASLYGSQFMPQLKAIQTAAQQMVAVGNQHLKMELQINNVDRLKFDLGVDGFCTDMWVLRVYTTDERPGIFGQEKSIVIDRVDPLNCVWDPKATRVDDFKSMAFFIVRDSLEIGTARARFRESANKIDRDLAQPDKEQKRYNGSQLLVLPGQRQGGYGSTERLRIQIKECWFHDDRYHFRAYSKPGENGKEVIEVDDDGYVKGQWEPAYPAGRCIVTASDKCILRDYANPFWDDDAPFIWCPQSPTTSYTKLLTVGKAAGILGIERKINDVETRVHAYAQAEIERPMIATVGAFPTNIAWYRTTGQSRAILVKNRMAEFARPPAVEAPVFIQPYLQRLGMYLNQCTGQNAIMRGDVAEGAQLSAEAVQSMQGASTSRLAMQAIYIATAMKKLGDKVFWLIRETYPSGLTCQIMMPDGNMKDIEWDEKACENAYFCQVDMATNAPGGKQAAIQQAIMLYREKLVPQSYVLPQIGIEGWEQIVQETEKQRQSDIFSAAAGRAAGVQIKQFQREAADPGPKPMPK